MKEEPHLMLQLLLQRRRDPMVEDMEETPCLTCGGDLAEGFSPQCRRFRSCPASRPRPLIGVRKERRYVNDGRDELRDSGSSGAW